jgi:peroxiredoxin
MGTMEEANQKLASDRFVMLAVSIDSEGFPAVDKFFQGKAPSFTVLLDREHRISHKYGTFKVPETYIIDKTGRVRDRIEGVKQWNDSLILHYLELLVKE